MPFTHHLTITDRYGKQIRGRVFYIQPKEERWREHHTEVHITTSDRLDPYCYPATYHWLGASVSDFFMAYRHKSVEGGYLFEGPFERANMN